MTHIHICRTFYQFWACYHGDTYLNNPYRINCCFLAFILLFITLCFYKTAYHLLVNCYRFKLIEPNLRQLKEEREAEKERLRLECEAAKQAAEDMHSSTSDEGVLMKENSGDELERWNKQYHRNDSEE